MKGYMFWRKWRQERWLDTVKIIGKLESREFETRTKMLQKDAVIECEKCGCLLFKDNKHKLPSTVETREIENWRSTGEVYYPPGVPYGFLQPEQYTKYTTKEEYMAEHYRCGRCRDASN